MSKEKMNQAGKYSAGHSADASPRKSGNAGSASGGGVSSKKAAAGASVDGGSASGAANSPKKASSEQKSRYNTLKRIAAIIAIVLLAGMYLVTFILAIIGNENSARLLRFSFGMTIFFPIFLWVIIWCAGYLFHKKTIASLDILDSNPEERRRMEEAIALEMDKAESENDAVLPPE